MNAREVIKFHNIATQVQINGENVASLQSFNQSHHQR